MQEWLEQLSDQRMLHRENHRNDSEYWSASSPWGVVTTAHYRATAAGVEMLAKGGNAFDAAVASSLALGVVESAGSGLGGMTMVILHLANSKRTIALKGPCRAPLNCDPKIAAASPRRRGYTAIAVPSNPAVLDYLMQKYGSLPLEVVAAPAICLAETGFPLTTLQHWLISRYASQLKAEGNASHLFLTAQGEPRPAGTWFRQPELAQTLQQLAKAGFQDFYHGEIGQRMLADLQQNNSFITAADFEQIPWPVEAAPLTSQIGEWTICTFPPPGGGTTLLQMLHLFDCLVTENFNLDSPAGVVLLASIIRRARQDRRKFPAGKAPVAENLSVDLASQMYAQMAAAEITEALNAGGETSHLCVIDRHHNVVSMTQSIERSFGAAVLTPELGFLYNGYMKTFKLENPKHPFFLRPGAAARSNAAPTIVLQRGKPLFAIGSTGSERMISGIFEVLIRLRNQSPFTAVSAPRFHCTPQGIVMYESRLSEAAVVALRQHGFTLKAFKPWSFKVGGLHLAGLVGQTATGVAEPRRDGAAMGPVEEPLVY